MKNLQNNNTNQFNTVYMTTEEMNKNIEAIQSVLMSSTTTITVGTLTEIARALEAMKQKDPAPKKEEKVTK